MQNAADHHRPQASIPKYLCKYLPFHNLVRPSRAISASIERSHHITHASQCSVYPIQQQTTGAGEEAKASFSSVSSAWNSFRLITYYAFLNDTTEKKAKGDQKRAGVSALRSLDFISDFSFFSLQDKSPTVSRGILFEEGGRFLFPFVHWTIDDHALSSLLFFLFFLLLSPSILLVGGQSIQALRDLAMDIIFEQLESMMDHVRPALLPFLQTSPRN